MTLESVISIAVAVAVPVWLAVEQCLKWKVLMAWGSSMRVEAGRAPSRSDQAFPVGFSNNSTGSAFQRKVA